MKKCCCCVNLITAGYIVGLLGTFLCSIYVFVLSKFLKNYDVVIEDFKDKFPEYSEIMQKNRQCEYNISKSLVTLCSKITNRLRLEVKD